MVLIQGHEDDIDNNTQGYEEFGERIENQESKDLTDLDPKVGTIPEAKQVQDTHNVFLFKEMCFSVFITIQTRMARMATYLGYYLP